MEMNVTFFSPRSFSSLSPSPSLFLAVRSPPKNAPKSPQPDACLLPQLSDSRPLFAKERRWTDPRENRRCLSFHLFLPTVGCCSLPLSDSFPTHPAHPTTATATATPCRPTWSRWS